MTDSEIKQLFAQTDQRLAELIKSQAETDIKFKETDRFLKEIGKQVGGIGNVNGRILEDQIFYALERRPNLNGIAFDAVSRDWKRRKDDKEAQFDIVLETETAVGVVEVKQRLEHEDVVRFAEKTLPAFRDFYPDLSAKKLIAAVAGATIDDAAFQAAVGYGFYVLTPEGDTLKVLSDKVKVY
ncbi:MAG: hypothetical protein LDLANPLL_02589 [Turneriella sp.]|nr:hypothetical protein [Turneriella sp.]